MPNFPQSSYYEYAPGPVSYADAWSYSATAPDAMATHHHHAYSTPKMQSMSADHQQHGGDSSPSPLQNGGGNSSAASTTTAAAAAASAVATSTSSNLDYVYQYQAVASSYGPLDGGKRLIEMHTYAVC